MRSVTRSPEPAFLGSMRADHTQWDDLDGGDRQRIRNALVQDFGPVLCLLPATMCRTYQE